MNTKKKLEKNSACVCLNVCKWKTMKKREDPTIFFNYLFTVVFFRFCIRLKQLLFEVQSII